jgi:hypothetical protein
MYTGKYIRYICIINLEVLFLRIKICEKFIILCFYYLNTNVMHYLNMKNHVHNFCV